MSRFLLLFVLLVVTGCSTGTTQVTQEKQHIDMADSVNKLSYAAGYKMGDMFQNQKLRVNPDAVLKGLSDARQNVSPAMTKAQINTILRDPKAFLLSESDVQSAQALQEEASFFHANGQRKGVVVLPSGLQYKILRAGQGNSPQPTDRVKIKYIGKQINGNVFGTSSSTGEPAEFTMQSLVPGLIEGLKLMKEGDKWEFYIPSSLAFGNRSPLASRALIFEVELFEVIPAR